jgi:hypothetical protein
LNHGEQRPKGNNLTEALLRGRVDTRNCTIQVKSLLAMQMVSEEASEFMEVNGFFGKGEDGLSRADDSHAITKMNRKGIFLKRRMKRSLMNQQRAGLGGPIR